MYEFKMPSLGADMSHGKLLKWMIKPGDHVKRGDIVAVVDTEKAAIEIESFEDGIVDQLMIEPQTDVPVGATIALLRGETETVPAPSRVAEVQPPREKISPRARKEKADSRKETAVEKIDQIRAAMASIMAKSKREIPHFYLAHEIDLTTALNWLSRKNEAKPIEERWVYSVLLIKAVAIAAKRFPEVNGFWREERFQPASSCHIGVVISLRQGGLMVPALRDVDQKNTDQLMKELNDLVSRTRSGSLRSSDVSEATISVSNLGENGVDQVFGVIYPPQVALVGFGRVKPNRMMQITLSADHRVIDGHGGGRFLLLVADLLQRPGDL